MFTLRTPGANFNSCLVSPETLCWKFSLLIYISVHLKKILYTNEVVYLTLVGLGAIGVTCLPRDPRFADSNPAEVDEFFQLLEILSTSPSGWTLS